MRAVRYRQASWEEPLVFELGRGGAEGTRLPEAAEPPEVPEVLRRKELNLPQLSEPEVVRHFTRLAEMSFGRDSGFYPLGSCTMKYNPAVCEEVAGREEILNLHPDQPCETVQGVLELMYLLERLLAEIGGVHRVSLAPAAGAHGEFVSMLIIRAYHESRGERRTQVIVPDSAHGTNPASAAMAGFEVVTVPSDARGRVELEALRSAVSEQTAAMMLTNPNTLGLFEDRILEIVEVVHGVGGLMFYDGANLNGIMGRARPGDMGFDLVHFNLHKTFSTPHGGGGPGAGPVGVRKGLEEFLPVPLVEYDEGRKLYYLDYNRPKSIGRVRQSPGSLPVLMKALAYLLLMGGEGLKEASEVAVLNANYLAHKLSKLEGLEFRYSLPCKHEFVLSAEPLRRETGLGARDLAKGLMDFGFHPPTVYFPPIVPEALMIEPTESEPREELDRFVEAVRTLVEEARVNPQALKSAPRSTPVGRVDEVTASREPVLSWRMLRQKRRG
jgi:glycine dehydrogenase subunit 2